VTENPSIAFGPKVEMAGAVFQQSITLRDIFAAAALAGMGPSHDFTRVMDGALARQAYSLADAMLKVRESR
jgi:hypothetical protein